jgi:hypothetical protein
MSQLPLFHCKAGAARVIGAKFALSVKDKKVIYRCRLTPGVVGYVLQVVVSDSI